jgi:hypothetical protein
MVKRWIRVFTEVSDTITDKTLASQDGSGVTCNFATSGDYIYVGQYFPFNNFTIDPLVANTSGAEMLVEYWDGSNWTDMVDLLDGTSSGSVSLARHGTVQFSPDKDSSWTRVSDVSDETGMGLGELKVYDLYWSRVSFDAPLSATASIKELRYKFCEHADLAKVDPEINEYLNGWGGVSKTTWNEQIFEASDNIISELKERKLILHEGQILRFDDVYKACVYQTLMLIYSQLGPSFTNKYEYFERLYKQHLGDKRFTFDATRDGMVNTSEISMSVGMGVR